MKIFNSSAIERRDRQLRAAYEAALGLTTAYKHVGVPHRLFRDAKGRYTIAPAQVARIALRSIRRHIIENQGKDDFMTEKISILVETHESYPFFDQKKVYRAYDQGDLYDDALE